MTNILLGKEGGSFAKHVCHEVAEDFEMAVFSPPVYVHGLMRVT